MPAVKTFELNVPVDMLEGDKATQIVWKRRINGGDLAAAGIALNLGETEMKLSAAQANIIISRCTGIPELIVEKIDGSDWFQLYGYTAAFFVPPQQSGETE